MASETVLFRPTEVFDQRTEKFRQRETRKDTQGVVRKTFYGIRLSSKLYLRARLHIIIRSAWAGGDEKKKIESSINLEITR